MFLHPRSIFNPALTMVSKELENSFRNRSRGGCTGKRNDVFCLLGSVTALGLSFNMTSIWPILPWWEIYYRSDLSWYSSLCSFVIRYWAYFSNECQQARATAWNQHVASSKQAKDNTSYSKCMSTRTPCYRILQMLKCRANEKRITKINARGKKKKSGPIKCRGITFTTDPDLRMAEAWENIIFLSRCCISA